MSSTTSINVSNESPHEALLQLPPHHQDSPAPLALLPCTIHTMLQTQPNLNTTLLQGITNGLLQTIADREASTSITAKQYEDHIHNLEQWVLHYEATFNEPPAGYMVNNGKVSNFHIVTTMGSQLPVMDSHYLWNNYYTETPQILPLRCPYVYF
jgi:hypothetical protein